MKDWGWENRESGTELGLFLDLAADFSQGSDNHRWFKEMKLKHYSLYEGPFPHWQHQAPPVCVFIEKRFYKELAQWFKNGVRISYASYYHYAYLQPSRLVLVRAWGMQGTEASDCAIIRQLFDHGIEIGEWLIQDLDHGNEWIRASGTASFKAYIDYAG